MADFGENKEPVSATDCSRECKCMWVQTNAAAGWNGEGLYVCVYWQSFCVAESWSSLELRSSRKKQENANTDANAKRTTLSWSLPPKSKHSARDQRCMKPVELTKTEIYSRLWRGVCEGLKLDELLIYSRIISVYLCWSRRNIFYWTLHTRSI